MIEILFDYTPALDIFIENIETRDFFSLTCVNKNINYELSADHVIKNLANVAANHTNILIFASINLNLKMVKFIHSHGFNNLNINQVKSMFTEKFKIVKKFYNDLNSQYLKFISLEKNSKRSHKRIFKSHFIKKYQLFQQIEIMRPKIDRISLIEKELDNFPLHTPIIYCSSYYILN